MSFEFYTNARVNLLGNPSDIYYGITVSSTIESLRVKGTIKKSEFKEYIINGFYDEGFNTLINSSVMFLEQKEFKIRPFTFAVATDIPKQAGLAGSSAIIINLLNCLNKLYQYNLDRRTIAHYATIIEHEVIGLTAGPSDRFIITYGGAKFMDYTCKDYRNYLIEDLDLKSIPLWVGIRTKNISSGDIHKFPYRAYPENVELQEVVENLKKCGVLGKEAIENNDIQLLGKLMNKNQKLTNVYGTFGNPDKNVQLQRRIDKEILNFCNDNGIIGAKLVGSSGSIIILSEEKPEFLFDFNPSKELNKELPYDSSEPQISEIVRLKPGKTN
ncbi:MAG: mevalonate kinase [Candidatus Hodarchaeota archaeon]